MSTHMEHMMAFEKVRTCSELQKHLIDRASRLNNTKNGVPRYLCHYTNLRAAISIIRARKWYIGSPFCMNDGLELSHAADDVWKTIFFASFMLEPKESIAMWSMYAQPWSDGVMIRIPVEKFKKWIKSETLTVHAADESTKEPIGGNIASKIKCVFHAVAYTNAEDLAAIEEEQLWCGSESNTKVKNTLGSDELVGYIKDVAWAYENEYRLQINYNESDTPKAVSISIPEDVIDSIEIVAGPRFNGSLIDRVKKEIGIILSGGRIHNSLYKGKLRRLYCDICSGGK